MFVAKDRIPHDAAAPRRPVTLAAFLPAGWPEVPPANSTLEPCKMDALCFDNDTKPFCRNPFCLILIQNPRGVYPLYFMLTIFNELQNAPALPWSVRDLPVRHSGQFSTGGRSMGNRARTLLGARQKIGRNLSNGCGLYLQPAQIGCGLYLQPTQIILLPTPHKTKALRTTLTLRLATPYPLETDRHSRPRAYNAWIYSRKFSNFAAKANVA
jgi:hypothetical protein